MSSFPNLPKKIKDRIVNKKYIKPNGEIVIWTGTRLHCKHGKQKSTCRECGGSAFCKHGKHKSTCRECGGSAFCKHGKYKSTCRECGGSAFCKHGKQKPRCRDCGGSAFCEHGKYKSICRDCGGSAFCKHEIQKSQCRDCGGSALCNGQGGLCVQQKNLKYNGYCASCFIHMFPDDPLASQVRTKTKEYEVLNFIKQQVMTHFPEKNNIIHNKSSGNICTRNDNENSNGHSFPDIRIDCGFFQLIIEIDEYQHRGADYSCDESRMYNIISNLGMPCIFIRYNPDGNESNLTTLWNQVRYYLSLKIDDEFYVWNEYGFKVDYLFYE